MKYSSKSMICQLWHRICRGGVIQTSLLLAGIFPSTKLSAQMNGWPLNTHGSSTISLSQTWCTDRARITAVSGSTVKTLTLSNFTGSFTNGDWVIVIQMHGSNMGNHTLCEVVSTGTISSPATSINVQPYVGGGYSNSWPALSFVNSDDRVQIVKVARFWDLTITAGIIDCPAYDASTGTGGILAIMVGNQFTMTGGFLNASGKGFHTHFNSGGLGVGGVATPTTLNYIPTGTGMGSHTGAVDKNQNTFYSVTVTPNGNLARYGEVGGILHNNGMNASFKTSSHGGQGGLANNNIIPGGATTGEKYYWFGHSQYPGNLHLGCSGVSSNNAGTGGGGGGWGGAGGSTNNLTPPVYSGQNGAPGESGKAGGNCGQAGIGGGIIYLKVANSTLSFNNSLKRIVAYGTNGENGGKGGDGGKGGAGGYGGAGFCNGGDFISPGGVGGYGDGGIGGNGGDGANPGCGGTVWIIKKVGGNHSSFGAFVGNQPGDPGEGGSPGYTPTYEKAPRPTNFTIPLSSMPCNTGGQFTLAPPWQVCIPVSCDCDEVFRHLGVDMAGTVYPIASGTNWSINKTGQTPVYWDQLNTLFYTKIVGSCTTKYECKMKMNSRFADFMNKAFGQYNLQTYNGTPANVGIGNAGTTGIKTTLATASNHLVFEYDPVTDRLTDYDNLTHPYVDVDVCPYDYEKIQSSPSGNSGSGQGEPQNDEILIIKTPTGKAGSNGTTRLDGDYEETEEQTPPPINNHLQTDDLNNAVKVQVTATGLAVDNLSGLETEYCIYDAKGTLVYKTLTAADFNLPQLSPGVYFAYIKLGAKEARRKIYIH